MTLQVSKLQNTTSEMSLAYFEKKIFFNKSPIRFITVLENYQKSLIFNELNCQFGLKLPIEKSVEKWQKGIRGLDSLKSAEILLAGGAPPALKALTKENSSWKSIRWHPKTADQRTNAWSG